MVNAEFLGHLQEIVGEGQCHAEESMAAHTTFRVGGPAEYYVRPSKGQVRQVIALCQRYGMPWSVIGNGSNLLVSDKGICGLVMELGKRAGAISIEGNRVTAEAGALLSQVAGCAASHSLTGMEFAAGIPGSIGGAVVMNAGAYGGEMKQVLTKVDVLTPEGEEKSLSVEELELGYRKSCIPHNHYVVLQAELLLEPGDPQAIASRMAELKERRVSKQPLEYPSAGSTFKRPEGYFAGKLIQDAGLCGCQMGGAQISEKHCGFLVNKGHATASDIWQLICHVQAQVEEKFGVHLETEVKRMGDFSEVSMP